MCINYYGVHMVGLVNNIESAQRRLAKLIHKLKNILYNGKLKVLKLPTLT